MQRLVQPQPTPNGEEGSGGKGYDMSKEKPDLKELIAVLRKDVDKIGPVDSKLDQKAQSGDL